MFSKVLLDSLDSEHLREELIEVRLGVLTSLANDLIVVNLKQVAEFASGHALVEWNLMLKAIEDNLSVILIEGHDMHFHC